MGRRRVYITRIGILFILSFSQTFGRELMARVFSCSSSSLSAVGLYFHFIYFIVYGRQQRGSVFNDQGQRQERSALSTHSCHCLLSPRRTRWWEFVPSAQSWQTVSAGEAPRTVGWQPTAWSHIDRQSLCRGELHARASVKPYSEL